MKTIEEEREPVEWPEIPEVGDKFNISVYDEWSGVNKEMKERIQKARRHPLEWVLIGVMLGICGMILIEIIRGILWILHY